MKTISKLVICGAVAIAMSTSAFACQQCKPRMLKGGTNITVKSYNFHGNGAGQAFFRGKRGQAFSDTRIVLTPKGGKMIQHSGAVVGGPRSGVARSSGQANFVGWSKTVQKRSKFGKRKRRQ